ncbi:GUN4 domain-containing protein [Microcoleus sp. LEGE 07076]|uniref:serine/threonine-protein kinase n=1 Tax=Microcoleus sp. LEGE 07076 TaxID=915322 RepID=UPI0018811AD8|nr:serine/threonine-protein kinase [Microcoleus sp. LEGE 07076]MBE9187189.1 GUN4 domain-containing protein [Microcoleus sp. LEGE 07076]
MLWTPGQILKTRPLRIDDILGMGGFGITYKATHLQLNYQVVLKTPNLSLQNDPEYPNFVRRFIREGQILAKFCQNAHPGIVRISDLFEEKGLHCLVMDLIVGQSLFDAVQQQGRLPDTEAVAIIRQIGEALSDVHQAGIVHRDAHPGNIMLRPNGQAVLIDFGLASELMPTIISSKHPHNPAFAPWEQYIEGSGKPTVDIYALAASLYYAVTGKAPTASLNRQFRNEALPPAKNFGVQDWVSLAIEKGMASDPQKRPQSMKDWLSYLREPIPSTVAGVSVQLKSARGVDYTRLRDLLAAEKWKKADKETLKVMLKAARREKEGYFNRESIDNFPCDDLRTIDQLWVKYSQGLFGLSVQKKFWLEVGGKVDWETERKLGDRVGWLKGGNWLDGVWLNYDDLTFNLTAQSGHLPWWCGVRVRVFGVVWGGGWGLFFSRIESCKL